MMGGTRNVLVLRGGLFALIVPLRVRVPRPPACAAVLRRGKATQDPSYDACDKMMDEHEEDIVRIILKTRNKPVLRP